MTFTIKGRAGSNSRGYALWQGICDECGRERLFTSPQVKSGKVKACDCIIQKRRDQVNDWYKKNNYLITLKDYLYKKKHNSWHLLETNLPPKIELPESREDLSGQTFNGIKALYPCGYNSDHRVMFVCQCFCGTYFLTSARNLKSGITKSCDCLRTEHVVQANMARTEDVIGKTFGKLKVQEFAGFTLGSDGKRKALYKCLCKCGRECIKQGTYLRCGDTQTCGLCANSHGEIAIANFLEERNIEYISQYNFDDCRNITGALLYYDFAVFDKEQNLLGLIEFDGEQHYNPNLKGWFLNEYENIHQRDLIKDNYCKEHNLKLFRIRFDENLTERMEAIINELRC